MRLIDADKLDFSFDRRCFCEEDEGYVRGADDAISVVENAPTIDAVPVVYGRWVYGEDVDIQCSICGHDAYTEGDYRQVKTNYCPNCGARMDKEDEHEAD